MIGFDAHVKFAIVDQHRPHGERRTDLQPTDGYTVVSEMLRSEKRPTRQLRGP